MTTESFDTELIERYLRSRKLRCFRGHHDGEYFFIHTVGHERLHVHLEISPGGPETLTIRVTPAHFFSAADRARLAHFADTWNQETGRVKAVVHESCDLTRIAVVAENCYPIAGMPFDEFATVADDAIRSAVELFAGIPPTHGLGTWLKDAG